MAGEFKNGVQWFTKGIASIPIYFPEDQVKCQHCPFCRAENDLKRYWCRLTNQMIYNPYVPELPDNCPIYFSGEVIGKNQNKGE